VIGGSLEQPTHNVWQELACGALGFGVHSARPLVNLEIAGGSVQAALANVPKSVRIGHENGP
jgi:hypothetical protein